MDKVEFKRLGVDALDLKAPGEDMAFAGYGAVFGNVDSYGDVIEKGAFAKSLAEAEKAGRWPAMLEQHGGFFGPASDNTPIGIWTKFDENARGLRVEGKLAPTARGKDLYALMKMEPRPAIDGLSIGYIAKKFTVGTKPSEPRRTLHEVELMEVSLVTFPANDKARVTAVKGFFAGMSGQDWRDLEAALRDEGLSRADATKAVSGLKSWLQRDAGEPGSGPRDDGLPAEWLHALNKAAAALG